MKRSLICGLAAVLALGASAVRAQESSDDNVNNTIAGYFDDSSFIELGAGAMVETGSDTPIEALIKVEADGIHGTGFGTGFVLARINTVLAAGAEGVPYVDVEFEGLGYQLGLGEDFARVTFANIEYERNVTIENAGTFRFSLVGVRGQLETKPDQNIKFILSGALDLLGLSYTKRTTDGSSLFGSGWGAQGAATVELYEKFRITLGGEINATLGKPEQVYAGTECETYHDEWHSWTECYDDYDTKWNDVRLNGTAYLDIVAQLTKNFSVFGRAAVNVYSVQDSTGSVAPSADANFQFMVGLNYKF